VGSNKSEAAYSARAVGINRAMEEITLVDDNGKEIHNLAGEP
jgi:hypothetical protein